MNLLQHVFILDFSISNGSGKQGMRTTIADEFAATRVHP
jgi:hypothetical protein